MHLGFVKKTKVFYMATMPIIFLFIVFISNRNPMLPDYVMYLGIFNNIDYRQGIEFTYPAIVRIVHYFNGGVVDVMLIYAFLGIYIKSKVIFSKTTIDGSVFYYYTFLIGYLLSFALVWEYIQIRAAVGISFFLLGAFCDKNRDKYVSFALACSFHYSMLLPCSLYICFMCVSSLRLRLISLPVILASATAFFYLTPYSRSYSASNYMISGKGILSTQYCLVYLNIVITLFFYKSLKVYKEENKRVFFSAITITFMMVIFNKGFPAFTDRLMDIATFISFVPLFFIRNKGYKYFLFIYIIFFGLMRLRVISSGLDPHVMTMSSFFSF